MSLETTSLCCSRQIKLSWIVNTGERHRCMATLDVELHNRLAVDRDPFSFFLRELLEATSKQATTELPAFVSERSSGQKHIPHEADGCRYLDVLFGHEGIVPL